MKAIPATLALFAAILALASCNSVFKAARSGEADPESSFGAHKRTSVVEQQMDTQDKIHDQSLRR